MLGGIHTSGGAQALRFLEMGFEMATICTDATLLSTGTQRELGAAR